MDPQHIASLCSVDRYKAHQQRQSGKGFLKGESAEEASEAERVTGSLTGRHTGLKVYLEAELVLSWCWMFAV